MNSYLQTKLKSLIERKKTSIASLEKSAGINRDSLRNIITGKSKSPSLNLVSSIAKVLDANISDFVESDNNLESDIPIKFPEEKLPWDKDLLQDSINMIQLSINKYNLNVDFDKAMKFVKEVYAYSIGKNPHEKKVDSNFSDWLIKSTLRR